MKRKLTALLVYCLWWLVFFIFARLLFLLVQFREMTQYGTGTIVNTFIHGFRLDLATTAYIALVPLVIAIPALLFRGQWYRTFLKVYTFTLILIFTALILGDAGIYSYWGFRLEFSVLGYLKNPGDALASASTLQLILFIAVYAIISILFILIFNRFANKHVDQVMGPENPVTALPLMLFLFAAALIAIRGGLGVAPLNAGSVYFSPHLFPNHAAINIIWNFGHTAIYSKPATNPYRFEKIEDASSDVKALLSDNDTAGKVLNTERPNILIIILESFGSYLTEMSKPDSLVTPRFREYIPKGIYFSNFFAAGSRTDKAIPAILSGYPNLPLIQVIREPRKTQSMPGIIRMLDSAGYATSFWYGGDIDFANLNSYLTTTGFHNKITRNNFKAEDCNSKWGAHDDVLFKLLLDSLPRMRQPFACTVLTLSSHEPFEVPMKAVFKGEDVLSKFMNSVRYTDMALGNFLDIAGNSDWWKNTLVIILADHCRRNSERVPVYSEEIFKIPMLWLGGALDVNNRVVTKYGNQFDLPLTLADQLNMKSSFSFSKDLLSPGSSSFSFYTFNEGFAFISDSVTAIYDVKMKRNVEASGTRPAWAERMGKSFLEVLYDDYLKR